MNRFWDSLFIILASPIVLPLSLVIAVLVLVTMGAPVLFRQLRPGREGREFTIYKFRTMTDERDSSGRPLQDERRLTAVGGFLRAWSLDELPELWNVLKGDMSLVGPRPLHTSYLPLYSAYHARRHEIRPGITGWAQVNGRNAASWDDRLNMDVWYVENKSLWLDLRILWLTVWAVFRREGISADGHATMPRFTGSRQH